MKIIRITAVLAALFACSSAFAQNAGNVTNHAFAIGKGAGVIGYTSLLCTNAQLVVGQSAADPICQTITGDVTISAGGVTAIGASKVHSSMLNADVFSTANSWSATQSFPNNSLTLAELPAFGAAGVLGAAAAGNTAQLTKTQLTALLNPFTATLNGAVPSPGASTGKFLRDDATWQSVAGSGTVTSITCFGVAITTSGTCTTAAAKTDQQSGSSASLVVTPSQQQSHDSATKAWVYWSGTTINASYNVSGVTNPSTGNYTVTFTTPFANGNYSCVCTVTEGGAANLCNALSNATRLAGSIQVQGLTTGGTAGNFASGDLQCHGRQ